MFKKRLMQQVTSGAVSSLFSPVKKKAPKKSFWMMVDAELIVYGQTEPNASVTVRSPTAAAEAVCVFLGSVL